MPSYKWRIVAMLWCISFFNYADRQAIFSVFPLLEREMHLTPVQLGLLGPGSRVYGIAASCGRRGRPRLPRVRRCSGTAYLEHHLYGHGDLAQVPPTVLFRAAEDWRDVLFPASTSLIGAYHGT